MKFLKSKITPGDLGKSDNEVIAGYRQSGDDVYIEILFNRYCHLVFAVSVNYLHSEDESKDAVIEIFEKIGTDLRRYDIRDFGSWLHTVTRNHCLHRLKKRRITVDLKEEGTDLAQQAFDLYFDADTTEEKEKFYLSHLEAALASLAEEQQICVELFYLREKSYEEIARSTGYSYNQVKSYIQNGKRNMKIYFNGIHNEQ